MYLLLHVSHTLTQGGIPCRQDSSTIHGLHCRLPYRAMPERASRVTTNQSSKVRAVHEAGYNAVPRVGANIGSRDTIASRYRLFHQGSDPALAELVVADQKALAQPRHLLLLSSTISCLSFSSRPSQILGQVQGHFRHILAQS
jgi:hypothetical protein